MADSWLSNVDASTYRRLDQATKLLGVGLVAAGLEAGGGTTAGLVLGLTGVSVALCTVFLSVDNSASTVDSDEQREGSTTDV